MFRKIILLRLDSRDSGRETSSTSDDCFQLQTLRQGCCIYHGFTNCRKMTGVKNIQNLTCENKRQKTSAIWQEIHSESSYHEERLAMDESQNSTAASDFGGLEVKLHDEELKHDISNCRIELPSENHVTDFRTETSFNTCVVQEREVDRNCGESTPLLNNKHSTSIEVAASLHRFIKGKGRSVQKKIEEDFGVRLIFPSSKKINCIEIVSDSTECIIQASERIQILVQEAIKSPHLDYSHFVSLPLAIHGELVDKLVNFQKSILGNDNFVEDNLRIDSDDGSTNDEGEDKQGANEAELAVKDESNKQNVKRTTTDIHVVSYPVKTSNFSNLSELRIDKSIFVKPKTFHLTVLMLKLWNKERVGAATMVLQGISSKVAEALGNRSILVKLKGLECMRGSLANARVLYVSVEEVGNEDRLLRACQVIIDAYVEAGLVLEKDAQQKLKLHATVMNARHRRRKRKVKKHDSFDARGIVDQYGAEEWGEYLIREAHLSERFVFQENGYYHCCASIPFPENTMAD